jgi:MFS superfamily sulfate permease-like transporter
MTEPVLSPGLAKRPRTGDIVAGLSIAGLLLPEAVAYAGIGNVPPQMAVIALFAGLACYALLGSSRFAIVSATSSSAAVLAAATASMANGNAELRLMLGIALVIFAGLFFLLASLARLGSITDFIAKPVLRGFTFGLAIVIILKQLPKVVGVYPASGDLLRFTLELFGQVSRWNPVGFAVCAVSLGLLFLLSRIKRIPGAIIVAALGIVVSKWLDLPQYGVTLVGPISLQFAMPALPALSRIEWLRIAELALAVVMILYAESYGSIRSFAMKHGDTISPNRDLAALGAANLVSGLFHGMPVGAGYSVTSANEAAGAVSRFAGVVAAITILVIVCTMLPAVALTPDPVLAAIVIHAVSRTLNPAMFRRYFRWRRDRLVVIASVLGVLVLGVLDGLLAAIGVSMIMMLRRFSESTISVLGRLGQGHDFVSIALHSEAQSVSGILILRPDEPLFFANVERILNQARNRVGEAGKSIHTVILSLEESPDLDSSSLEALRDFYQAMSGQHKQVLFSRLKEPAQEGLKRADIPGLPASSICGLSVDDVVQRAQARKEVR